MEIKMRKNQIFYTGVLPNHSEIDVGRIVLINMAAVVPVIVYIAYSMIFLFTGQFPMLFLDCLLIVSCGSIIWCNKKGRFYTAKALVVCIHSGAIFLNYKIMLPHTGLLFYYFPLLLVFLTFYYREEEKSYFIFSFLFLCGCFLLSILIPGSFFTPVALTASFESILFKFNTIACFFITAFFIYHVFTATMQREYWLLKAKKDAEEAAQAKSIFLSNMSHELRTPINGIIGTTHVLQKEKVLPEQTGHFAVLGNLSAHMLSLVNNVLDFGKIQAGKLDLTPGGFNLKTFIDKIEATFRQPFKDKAISYTVKHNDFATGTNVFADELRLQQILFNLISNALKFSNAGGKVLVDICCKKIDADNIALHFSIVDNGIGIAADQLEKIFESFRQGDNATTRIHGGTGLGLSISDSLIKQFNSQLLVKSEQGKGSEFYFDLVLPVCKDEIIKKEKEAVAENALKDFRVLLADDNAINITVAKKIMQRWGIQVTEAENGLVAFELCKKQDFDLLLIDLEMPVLDGRMALQKIKTLNKNVPAIAFTATLFENMKDTLTGIGFDDYLLKPFVPGDLYRKIIWYKEKASG
jgi:signal transduction histidine kinase/ActR/RegA family two-component response regulator